MRAKFLKNRKTLGWLDRLRNKFTIKLSLISPSSLQYSGTNLWETIMRIKIGAAGKALNPSTSCLRSYHIYRIKQKEFSHHACHRVSSCLQIMGWSTCPLIPLSRSYNHHHKVVAYWSNNSMTIRSKRKSSRPSCRIFAEWFKHNSRKSSQYNFPKLIVPLSLRERPQKSCPRNRGWNA